MKSYIKKIYDLLYSPIITPYNLLENAELENYNYVKYYKGEKGLISEMECVCEEAVRKFYYCFDAENALSQILMETLGEKEIVFDRDIELDKIIDEYKILKDANLSMEAV